MREIKAETQINASPEKIWQTITDLPGWAAWNPIVNQADGELRLGSKISFTMAGKNGKDGQRYKAIVTELVINNKLSYSASMLASFLFFVDRKIEIEALKDGTKFTQREIYSGLLVPLFWGKMQQFAQPMLESMNQALKRKVE